MSDSKVTVQELKDKIKLFCEERDWDQYHAPKELSTGLIIEAAELLDQFRAMSEMQQLEALADPRKGKEIRDELSDSLYWILRFAQKYEIDLSDSLNSKMEQNAKKYPVDKAKGSNKKYNEL